MLSPYSTRGIAGSIFILNSRPLSPIRALVKATNSSNIDFISYSLLIISSLLASILEISKIPLTISSKLLEAIIISLTFSCAEAGISSSFKLSEKPTIALSGVLISWDILDKNSDLAWLAFSAASLANETCSNILTSGFSIVKYIIIVINEIVTDMNKISGLKILIIVTDATIIISKNNGIYFLFLIFL